MARQEGVLRYTGTMGNIRHYRMKGRDGWYASMKGGPTKEMIMKDKNFERTRENISDFSGVAHASRAFRNGINQLRRRFSDVTFNNRITTGIYKVMRGDEEGERGKRGVLYSKFGGRMTGMEWNKQRPLDGVLTCKKTVEFSEDGTKVKVTLRYSGEDMIKNTTKSKATHARVIMNVNTASDYAYDKDMGRHEAKNEKDNGKSAIKASDYIDLEKGLREDLVMECEIDAENGLKDCGVWVSLGVEFYQEAGDYYYSVKDSSVMKVVAFRGDKAEKKAVESEAKDNALNINDAEMNEEDSALAETASYRDVGMVEDGVWKFKKT